MSASGAQEERASPRPRYAYVDNITLDTNVDVLKVLNKNSSIVCSTPTIGRQTQSRESVLPSPITSVKRRV